jgi:integrase
LAPGNAHKQTHSETFSNYFCTNDLRIASIYMRAPRSANVKVVQRMLGHASAAMMLDSYADLFESDLDAVAASVRKIWARAASSC